MTQEFAALPPKQEQAAILLAENRHSDTEIAAQSGVSRASIARWKRRPAFQARVAALQSALNDATLASAIADRAARVAALDDRWERLKRVITERGAEPEMADVPGGPTGLLTRTYKQMGGGENATMLPEYAVDTGLLREMRAHEQQAAQELGQWSDKKESTIDVQHSGSVVFYLPEKSAPPDPGAPPEQ